MNEFGAASLVWGEAGAWPWVAGGFAAAVVGAVWAYRLESVDRGWRVSCAVLKVAAFALLLLCLLEPLWRTVRPEPGANRLLVAVDTSASLGVRDAGSDKTRGEALAALVAETQPWLIDASEEFSVVRTAFDDRLRSRADFSDLAFDGESSRVAGALDTLRQRHDGQPVAGLLLFTDGLATDLLAGWDADGAAPIYPVPVGASEAVADVAIGDVRVRQTHFEEAPVTLQASVTAQGSDARSVEVVLVDGEGASLDRQTVRLDDGVGSVRFTHAPDGAGVHDYGLRVETPSGTTEATTENNQRWVSVDRGEGPYRILYVSGRPNWEFKFLRRALQDDEELELVGLLRIARRQPKFTFLPRGADRRNTLYDGFDDTTDGNSEQYDEPVLLRIGTRDEFELREGFPVAAEDLFTYDAIIIDDLEAGFFSPDQRTLLEEFVGRRGGGLMVLGGLESFAEGGYAGTPLASLLPVELERAPAVRFDAAYRMDLTRDGWLEPWVRLRSEEDDERQRLTSMPPFRTVNRVGAVKPAASVLFDVDMDGGERRPGLVAHRFGNGRSAAMMVADLWRWDLARPEGEQSDLGRAWRQMMRWLVADVPQRLEVTSEADDDAQSIIVRVRDEAYRSEDDARVDLTVTHADGTTVNVDAVPSVDDPGAWVARWKSRAPGPVRVAAVATLADGSTLGPREAGWVRETAAAEFARLAVDRPVLEDLAEKTGGRVLEPSELSSFVDTLSRSELPEQIVDLDPLWHRWWVWALIMTALCAEWGIRRWRGWP